MSKKRSKKSLTEQIAGLSTPRPVSFHPDEEELADITAAKVSDFTYEEEGELEGDAFPSSSHVRFRALVEDDPKYAGKRVNRKDLDDHFEGMEPIDAVWCSSFRI